MAIGHWTDRGPQAGCAIVVLDRVERLQAQSDFDASRRHAFWNELRAVLSGRTRTLLSFQEVMRLARMEGQVDRGVQDVPVRQIRGSEGRAREFDATFLPLHPGLRERWARIEALMLRGVEMPPVELYKVGEVYFVKDGHHRVSVARRLGQELIRAQVIEVRTRAPLGPEVDAGELLRAAEFARFLEKTRLDRLRPSARMECSELGHYDVVFQHILGHRYFMSLERGHEVSMADAVADWYDSVYLPVLDVLERHHIAEHFPGWTRADLYVALTRAWLEMSTEGQSSGPEAAGAALLSDPPRDPPLSPPSGMLRRWVRQHIRRSIVLNAALRPLKRRRAP